MKLKNNRRGFTLIELLAVVIILGVIMTIAIPNIVATLDKNKRDSLVKDAKRAITSAEYTIRSETKYDYPDNNSAVVFSLNKLNNLDLEISPFDTYYSLEDSFVAITKEPVGSDFEYIYYVHLVSCTDKKCDNSEDNSVSKNRGINVARADSLDESGRYELVVKGEDVVTDYLENDTGGTYEGIKSAINDIRRSKGLTTINNVIVY
jgi:prepilin-type N-terminal cleavage/methylation domain-containing protein